MAGRTARNENVHVTSGVIVQISFKFGLKIRGLLSSVAHVFLFNDYLNTRVIPLYHFFYII